MFYKLGILKNFCKTHGKTSAPESFDEVVGRRPQAYYFILLKKDSSTSRNLQDFEEHRFIEQL